jgi:hypothetical protein
MPNSTKTSDEYDSRNDEIVYDGSPLRFFDYDRQVTRYAKKMLGATGIKIWNGSLPTPTNTNRASISKEWVVDVQDIKGYKEATLMDADVSPWKETIPGWNCARATPPGIL